MTDQTRRTIKSFEPSPEVLRMLERAAQEGIKLSHILNEGAKDWLTKKGYARKKDLTEKAAA